ncbi:PepSY domain-containing protein [Aquabacterium sp. CECT 9606]|uniref:PepSY domain-containing protein n=1 Tax=Aquabacterium sp. CECT 9606 TaxID=2845822 RepID=UPI001E2C20A9|nr:PepSY domain-containing protein [Aquabacterium sp. CECT 9606]CAH0352861.1 hypothetical protein AQB9606_02854 [Aquabacterium sp. CECT 9606]
MNIFGALRRAWRPCRRALYLTHRWLGIVGCLLFAMWFASGLVMMYVGFPALTQAERLGGLPPLRMAEAVLPPTAALVAGSVTETPERMRLEMLHAGPRAEPVWRIVDQQGRQQVLSARDGHPMGPFNAHQAEMIARAFAGQPQTRWAETLERDQWTVPGGLDALRPLHRIEIGDAAGTELYVSARTGEVVRDTSRHERFWNWLGAVPHWLYFTPLRANPPLWHEVVVWISGCCIVSAVTGLVLGVLRVRLRRRYRHGAVTPYRGWMACHHLAGMVGGIFVLTWIASGWLSMNPTGWFGRGGIDPAAMVRYRGAEPSMTLPWPPAALPDARELQVLWLAGRPLLQWHDAKGLATVVVAADGRRAVTTQLDIEQAIGHAWPGVQIKRSVLLTQEDRYWYGHHGTVTLPVWRLVLADDAGTWLHIDPANGQLLGSSTRNSRLERWLFNAPHSLDLPWLIQHRPAWDLVIATLCLAGLVVAISGTVVGWRRLRKLRATSSRQRGL